MAGFVAWVLSGIGGELPLSGREAAVVVLAGAGVARDFGLLRLRLPENARQVPQEIFFTKEPRRAALQFGFELGTGVRTRVSATAPYVLLAAVILLAPRFPLALVAGLGFGLGRAIMALARYWSPDQARWDESLRADARLVKRISAVMAALVAAWLTLAT